MRKVSSRTSRLEWAGEGGRGAHCELHFAVAHADWRQGTLRWWASGRTISRRRDRCRLFVEDDPSVAQMYKLKLELDATTSMCVGWRRSCSWPRAITPPISSSSTYGCPSSMYLGSSRRCVRIKTEVCRVILSNYSEKGSSSGPAAGSARLLDQDQTTPPTLAG